MFFSKKKIFLLLFVLSNSFISLSAEKINELELDDEEDIIRIEKDKKRSREVNNKKSQVDTLEYSTEKQIIFVVNRESLFKGSEEAKDKQIELNDSLKKIENELMEKYNKLEKKRESIEKKKKTAKPEAMQKEEEEFANDNYALQAWQMEQQMSLKAKEEAIMKEFLDSVSDAIKDFCHQKGNENVIVISVENYVPSKYDASVTIAETMNRKYAAAKKQKKNNSTDAQKAEKVEKKAKK